MGAGRSLGKREGKVKEKGIWLRIRERKQEKFKKGDGEFSDREVLRTGLKWVGSGGKL